MQATQFEFRFRLWIGFTIYFLGFWAPWVRYSAGAFVVPSAWLELSGELSGLMPLATATVVVTLVAILLAAFGTFLRIWGEAYLDRSVVHSGTMQSQAVVTAGPYRYLRNPLYLGSFLFLLAISVLMPVAGAIFAIVAMGLHLIMLVLREEQFLAAQHGEAYLAYKSLVPRFLPRMPARITAAPAAAHWGQAFLAESFQLTMTLCFAALAWRYDAQILIQALLICFGASLLIRAVAAKPS